MVRSFDNPITELRRQLLKEGHIWTRPKDGLERLDSPTLIERAASYLSQRKPAAKLLIILDQFEELVILQEKGSNVVVDVRVLLQTIQRYQGDGFLFLLSVRSDYLTLLEPVGVPQLHQHKNRYNISPFLYRDAATFVAAPESKLKIPQERLQRVLTEAEAADGTRGLLRPIILNMLGRVLVRIADKPEAERPTRALLRDDLRGVIDQPGWRAIARAILPLMLTKEDTKRPRKIGELSEKTNLDAHTVHGCLLELETSGYVRPISRPAEITNRVWEVSHDFVARLLGQILKTRQQDLLAIIRRVLYWVLLSGWIVVVAGLLLSGPWLEHVRVESVLRDRFYFYFTAEHGRYAVETSSTLFRDLDAAVPYLLKLGPIRSLTLSHCVFLTNIDALAKLKELERVQVDECISVTNYDVLGELKRLESLSVTTTRFVTNVHFLRDLRGLISLDLTWCGRLTNIDALSELKGLRRLDLTRCTSLTNLDALRELKGLEWLSLNSCESLRDLSPIKALTQLKTLDLKYCIHVKPEDIRELHMNLPQTDIIF